MGGIEGWSPLADLHGRRHTYLRISLTDRCNFRCVYCMPPEGIPLRERAEILTLEEVERLASIFVRLGVQKIRLTGGEPTLRRGLSQLMGSLSPLPGLDSLHITTNGFTLVDAAEEYRFRGLSGVNVSLDTLRQDRFLEIARREGLDRVRAGIEAALAAGIPIVKVNVVVMAGVNDDELLDFVSLAETRALHVRFIEFMPFEKNGWGRGRLFPYAQMRSRIEAMHRLVPLAGEPSDVAREFSLSGHRGTIGFVASMTDSFCSGCNRVRLTSDGRLKTCLFQPATLSLRDLMRAGSRDEVIAEGIREGMRGKWQEHPGMDELVRMDNASMVEIGG